MLLVVKRESFAAALTAAAAIVPVRSARPNLKNALLIGEADGMLEIQATDLEVGLRYRLKAESVQEPAALCVPCGILAGLLKECVEDVVTLETIGAKGVLTVGRDRYEIMGQESSDFPEVPKMSDENKLSVPAVEMAKMIDRTIFAAAQEQARYAINGVYMQCKEKLLEVVATDSHRLAYCKKKLKGSATEESALGEGVIVPIKMMQEIRKLCDNVPNNEELQLAVKDRIILVSGKTQTLSSLIVEGIFPKYQQVIPKDSDKEVTFKREALLQALRKIMFLTSEETRIVQITISDGTCLLESRAPDKGQAAVTVEADYKGETISIGFNPNYLLEALRVLAADMVRIELKNAKRPGILREGQDYLYVLMPAGPRE
ncbi:MAG: DNA polymerase III subunit beta [Planctomycetota bacterium]